MSSGRKQVDTSRAVGNRRRQTTGVSLPPGLTRRESALLDLLETELSYAQLAMRLGIRRNTLKSHLKNLFGKLGVRSRHSAVAFYLRQLLTPGGD